MDIGSKVRINVPGAPIHNHEGVITDFDIEMGSILVYIVEYTTPFKVEKKSFLTKGLWYENELVDIP